MANQKRENKLNLIYVLCGNAAYNRGDRGNLLAQLNILHRAFPQAQVVIDSYRSQVDKHWYNATVLSRGLFLNWQQIKYLRKADVVVWGGGALIADNSCRTIIPYWVLVIALIKFVLRKPIMAWAHGVVIETKLGAYLGRLPYLWVDMITVRDNNSYNTLKRIGVTNTNLYQTADPAILIEASPKEVGIKIIQDLGVNLNNPRPLFAISPTFWAFYHDRRDVIPYMFARKLGLRRSRNQHQIAAFKSSLIVLINNLISTYDANIIILPRYPSPLWDDLKHLREVKQKIAQPDNVFLFDQDNYPPQDYLSMWRVFDFVLSVALHDTLFSLALDVPCVQLYYEPKGRDLAHEIGAHNSMCNWSVLFKKNGINQVMALAEYAMAHPSSIGKKIQLQQAAKLNLHYLQKLLKQNDFVTENPMHQKQ